MAVVKRYIKDAKKHGLSADKIAMHLAEDIMAFDKEALQIAVCRNRLDKLCMAEGIPKVRWKIYQQDFLKYNFDTVQASYVIGNPPYITYHDLEEKEREYLKETFYSCEKGRFDYCYAFIEASMRALIPGGTLIYLVPVSIYRNRYAQNLRELIWRDIREIIDFSGCNIFPGITCSASFLICTKGCQQEQIYYESRETGEKRNVIKRYIPELADKWIFYDLSRGNRRFGDYFEVHNSVATLYNDAFLFYPDKEDIVYFTVGMHKIEKAICLPAISTKNEKRKDNKKQYIIFPYKRENGRISKYLEEEFETLFPCAYQYVKQYQPRLSDRKADKNVKWFEYGRRQVLNLLWKEKLVFPMVVTKKLKTYYGGIDAVPYAGYFVTKKRNSVLELEAAKIVLESIAFYQYVKVVGTATTQTSYRISVEDIKNYRFE